MFRRRSKDDCELKYQQAKAILKKQRETCKQSKLSPPKAEPDPLLPLSGKEKEERKKKYRKQV
tara:strand:- start:1118 stop:1306 length:189 start_codon:yes stop_codon:yes gene_type:complete